MGLLIKTAMGCAVIIAGIAVAVPTIYKTKINEIIAQEEEKLQREGAIVELKEDNDDFFNVKREYYVVIKDSSYILNKTGMISTVPEFGNIKKHLDETRFLLSVNLPKYPAVQTGAVKVSLDEFSPEIKNNLEKEKVGRKFITFVKNRGLLVSLDFEGYKLKQAILKDINLSLKDENSQLIQKTKNFTVKLEGDDKYKINMNDFDISVSDKENKFAFGIKSYQHEISKKDDLNANENIEIKNIIFKLSNDKNSAQNLKFELSDISSTSNIFTKKENVGAVSNMNVKKIIFNTFADTLEIGNFDSTISLKELNKELITDIYAAIQTGGMMDQAVVNEYAQELLSNGFKFNLEKFQIDYAKINLLNNKFDTGKIALQSNVTLLQNDIDINKRPMMDFLSVLTSSLNVQLSKDDITLIMNQFRLPPAFIQFVKIENNNAKIDAEFKNKELYVNSRRVL